VRPNLRCEPFLRLAEDDAPDAGPVDRAGAHRAGLGRGVESAFSEECEAVLSRRARRKKPLGMAGAVAALARKSSALLHEDFSLVVGENGAERMVTRVSRAFRDVEGLAQQRLVKGARRSGHGSLQRYRCSAF